MAKKEITVTQKIDSSLKVPYEFNSDRTTRKNCKLCQCEFRDEVEGWYEEQRRKNYSAIKTKLNEEKELKISVNAIKNHMLYHYKATERKSTLTEYMTDVQSWVLMQTNKVAALKTRIAILEREMMVIASEGEDLDLAERRKNAETIKKIADTLLTYDAKLKEYEKDMEPVRIVFNQLKVIVKDEMEGIEDVKARNIIYNVMGRLKDNVGDMIIESGN